MPATAGLLHPPCLRQHRGDRTVGSVRAKVLLQVWRLSMNYQVQVEQFCFRIHEVIERMIISTFRRPMYDVIKYMWTLDEFKQKVSKSIFYVAIT